MFKRLANLSVEEKRALLARALKKKGQPAVRAPLSLPQQRLWFLDQLEPGNPFYNLAVAVRISGVIHMDVVQRVLNEIVRRHESLRTTFRSEGGEPVQIISPPFPLPLKIIDLREGTSDEQDREIEQLVRQDALTSFDLSTGPLIRVTLLRQAHDQHIACLTMHHIISDGWSIGVFIRELAMLYRAFSSGQPSPLPELPIQYRDYARWQRQKFQGDVLDSLLAYWTDQLQGAPQVLDLPTDRPRPDTLTFGGAERTVILPPALSESLKDVSHKEGVTLFMTLLAALSTLLYRSTDQDDILIGVPIAGRERPETQALIGFLVNTLVLRVDLSGNPTFRQLLARVRETALGAYAHQDLPFDKLVDALRPPRSLNLNPLVQVMHLHQNIPMPVLEYPGLSLNRLEIHPGIARFDLALETEERDDGLRVKFEYSTDLFEGSTIDRLAGRYHLLLRAVASNPDQKISDISLLLDSERNRLLFGWNETEVNYPDEACIHHLFEAQVERTPDAVAVVFDGEQLTYRELNRRANQLAHHLRALGVGPEVRVGICLERSLAMVIGLLGILKAGGAYVPLDPAYPQERLAFIAADAQVPVLLTQEWWLELAVRGAEVICLDVDWDLIAQSSESNPVSGATADNLAYVIYTSGSTGRPKGVGIQHASVVNLVRWHQQVYDVTPTDRATQLASLSFDASVWELWPYLTAGASIHLPDEPAWRSQSKLMQWLAREAITICFLPTPLAEAVVDEPWPKDLALRALLTGGDTLHRGPRQAPPFDLVNHYGPTENTVVATCAPVAPGPEAGAPAIGRPIANTQVYLLDPHLQPVPVGAPGELHIGGAGLARGYLNRPELTAERFIPHPFTQEPGARLYKTGDLARYRADGNIEFLGRLDHQVKVRGFRIEPGEIETAMAQHPGVRETVVVARDDVGTADGGGTGANSGSRRLVAYFVSSKVPGPNVSELRRFLSSRLPDYMVPSAFVRLDAIPVSPNGKVDRQALPAPDGARPEMEKAFVAPRTLTEEVLAGIWAEVLGIEQVGVHDDFFELGGHSLLAMKLVAHMQEQFQIDIPVRTIFASPTVASLATKVELAQSGDQRPAQPSIQPAPEGAARPLSYSQEMLWFLEQFERGMAYNTPLGLRIKGPLDIKVLQRCLDEIVRRHEILHASITTAGGQAVHVIHPPRPAQLSIRDVSMLPESDRETQAMSLINELARTRFDLAEGHLIRFLLVCLGKQDHVLFVSVHHIIFDGWSIPVLLRELAVLYDAFSQGAPSPLPELAIQYPDFAYWQRNGQEADLEKELSYWREQLGGTVPVLDLPTDYPRSRTMSIEPEHEELVLSPSLTEALNQLSQNEGTTLFMTLLAAYQTLLHRYSGQEDLIVGTPTANRTRPETHDLIGFFAGFLPLRTDLSGDPPFRELLGRVRGTCLAAFSNPEPPIDRLWPLLGQIDPGRMPVCQAFFTLGEFPTHSLSIGKATLTSFIPYTIRISGFDIVLALKEQDQGLTGALLYRTDLFEAATIRRMVEHFQMLLAGLAADPTQRLSKLPLLTETERSQLIVEWNATQQEFPEEQCVHQLFEAQVERTPEAIALIFSSTEGQDQQLTYRELNARANQLAHFLQTLGVGPETLVGLCLERSPAMVVGMLGILKAGGAYLPLDPTYPNERLAFMLDDAQVSVLLTHSWISDRGSWIVKTHHASRITHHASRITTVCLDSDWDRIARESEENPASKVTAGNLAYVIYTSGSTGPPKGVMVEHRSVTNVITCFIRSYDLGAGDRVLQQASISFDVSVNEIFSILSAGGRLILPQQDEIPDVEKLVRLIVRYGVTIFGATPSALARFNAMKQEVATVRLILSGGEALSLADVDNLLKSAVVTNGYGPTETTVCASYYHLSLDGPGRTTVPIGKPLANYQIYILDQDLECAPTSCPGELCIGGAGVARGYLNKPELTAEKFVPNPFTPGERLYRTGDRARWLPDGQVEFLGRLDRQVKIRGFRVEPGEVEAVLRQHPGVHEAAVMLREGVAGEKRLVAYVVPQRGQEISAGDLRKLLQDNLPHYMVPSHFISMPALPLTPSGKLDLGSLPPPGGKRPDLEQPYVAPRNHDETVLVGIWEEILKLDKIGVHDDFFALGGHSLLTLPLMMRVKEAFQVDVPLRALFESPTVSGLARQIETMAAKDPRPLMPQMTLSDLQAEAVLDSTIQPEETEPQLGGTPACILLVGATGFLGAFLLHELLQQTQADIYCLVRSSDTEAGKKRIQATLKSYALWDECFASRIVPLIGDLTKPQLGLSERQFQQSAMTVDTVYHAGGLVNFVYPYFALKAANVLGTQEVLRLASRGKRKPVHFVSTLSVFGPGGTGDDVTIREDEDLDSIKSLTGGYAQSKWVAEKLVTLARSRGLPVSIYRPGRITGHSETGVWKRDDLMCQVIKGWIQLGSVPDVEMEMELDMTPVDYVSQAIVHLSMRQESLGKSFHLCSQSRLPVRRLIEWIRKCGYMLRPVPFDQWQKDLVNVAIGFVKNESSSPLSVAAELADLGRSTIEEVMFNARQVNVDCRNTLEALAGSGIACPPADAELMRKYFSYFVESGILDPPLSGRSLSNSATRQSLEAPP